MNIDEEIRIRILNKEKYLGRSCTEQEKKAEEAHARLGRSLRKPEEATAPKIAKEELLEAIKAEGLSEYVKVEINTYDDLGEFYAVINKIEEYYTLLATGERGIITMNSVFATPEEACYGLLEYMRVVKKALEIGNYRPHGKKEAMRE